MAKPTLLKLVQDILSAMDSDEVNSINDTTESLQVATTIENVYYEVMGNNNWPHLRSLMQLGAVSDLSRPTHMRLPELVKEVDKIVGIRYNKRTPQQNRDIYQTVQYLYMDKFLEVVNNRDSSLSNMQVVTDTDGASLIIRNDRHPEYWTSFDDDYIVFDAFNKDVDSTLQNSKTQVVAYKSPIFTYADTFVLDLPEDMFPLIFNEAKSLCFLEMKKEQNAKAEQAAARQKRWQSRKSWRAAGGVRYPDFGRKSPKGTSAIRNPQFGFHND